MSASSFSNHSAALSLSDFLSMSHDAPIQPHVVVGNEAGDADSIVSALTLAHVDSIYINVPKTPIVSIPRNDICLRRETVYLLEKLAGINVDKLHYIDDAAVVEALLEGAVDSVTLVDHNRLTVGTCAESKVVEILDHHYDEDGHGHVTGKRRNIAFVDDKALVASTCTLVAERLFSSNATPPYPSDLSIVLLGVILLDSVNMKPEAHKGTARDRAAIDKLLRETDWSTLHETCDLIKSDGFIDTDKLFQRLSESKYDVDFWNELSVNDALRLDYKRFEAASSSNNDAVFGASSILLDMDSFLSKKRLSEGIQSFMKEVDVPLLVVLSNKLENGTPFRELLLVGSDEKPVGDVVSFLLKSPEAETMQVEERPLEMATEALTVRRFQQHNPKASRKQVAPIILSFYSPSEEKL